MKVGIMTFYDSSDNYGQVLQCYALVNYLKLKGMEPLLIRYNNNFDDKSSLIIKLSKMLNPKILYRKLKNYSKPIFSNQTIDRGFNSFRNRNIPMYDIEYNSFEELKKNPPKVDMIVVGSDQVWNVFDPEGKANEKKLNAYMLGFVSDKTKKVSIAPSFGRNNINCKEYKKVEKLLKSFDLVTVREESGVDICNKCNISDVKWVIDPTLYFDDKFYIDKFDIKKTNEEPYLFLYYVENGGKFPIKNVYDFAVKKGLKVKYVTANSANDDFDKIYPEVENWVNQIANAEYIITNSFHCCVFSMIFKRKFGVIEINGVNSGMNSRIESLFKITHTTPRIINSYDFSDLELPIEKYKIDSINNFDTYFDKLID